MTFNIQFLTTFIGVALIKIKEGLSSMSTVVCTLWVSCSHKASLLINVLSEDKIGIFFSKRLVMGKFIL